MAYCVAQGATLILSGLVSAAVTSPLFDRVLTHHLGITLRITTPFLGATWIALIWASTSFFVHDNIMQAE
jgi:hypothetical protein